MVTDEHGGPDCGDDIPEAGGETAVPQKECPECKALYSSGESFCSQDGSELVAKPIRRVCPDCKMEFPLDTNFCPDDGSRLSDVIPGAQEYGSTLTIDGQTWVAVSLSPGEHDQIQRSICPQCDSWKNWAGQRMHYICKQCGAEFSFEKDNVFRLLGTVNG